MRRAASRAATSTHGSRPRSADELERLVAAFNRMAGDLLVQRRRLERTHRLEAWAEMARQVAHEIKNPLTPVQLSAEHLLRVHRDRGEPLGAVLRDCVDSILTQVVLLRRIASEFSSYASSPPVNRESTVLADVVREVLDPYRTGLAGRIRLTVDVPATLPRLVIDRTLVARAFTNVVENALHAMPGDGRLSVSATANVHAVALVVRDTGVGLDETCALPRVRTVFLDEGVRHRPGHGDRQTQRRVERRQHRDRQPQRRGRRGHDAIPRRDRCRQGRPSHHPPDA